MITLNHYCIAYRVLSACVNLARASEASASLSGVDFFVWRLLLCVVCFLVGFSSSSLAVFVCGMSVKFKFWAPPDFVGFLRAGLSAEDALTDRRLPEEVGVLFLFLAVSKVVKASISSLLKTNLVGDTGVLDCDSVEALRTFR